MSGFAPPDQLVPIDRPGTLSPTRSSPGGSAVGDYMARASPMRTAGGLRTSFHRFVIGGTAATQAKASVFGRMAAGAQGKAVPLSGLPCRCSCTSSPTDDDLPFQSGPGPSRGISPSASRAPRTDSPSAVTQYMRAVSAQSGGCRCLEIENGHVHMFTLAFYTGHYEH